MSGYTQIVTKEGVVPTEGYIVVSDSTHIKCSFENIEKVSKNVVGENRYIADATFERIDGTEKLKENALAPSMVILVQRIDTNSWIIKNTIFNNQVGDSLLLLEKKQNGGRRRKTRRRKHRKNRKHSHKKKLKSRLDRKGVVQAHGTLTRTTQKVRQIQRQGGAAESKARANGGGPSGQGCCGACCCCCCCCYKKEGPLGPLFLFSKP
jgi:hypothetical protein